MKSTYSEAAERQAREASALELAAKLEEYASDVEAEGRTYAPAFMREAARRLTDARCATLAALAVQPPKKTDDST